MTLAACSGGPSGLHPDAPGTPADASGDALAAACSTLVSYGASWIHGANHPATTDLADGPVTWDGVCHDDGANSYAELSNGWKPYFTGHGSCAIAVDPSAGCGPAPACTTRLTYGDAWLHPANHAAPYDEVAGRVFWDGSCDPSGSDSATTLSNGWAPHFTGTASCEIAQRWTGCGGLYTNAVIPHDCADPGVVRDGDHYLLSCTSGNAASAFPIYTSTDLVTWTAMGHILPSAAKPAWAVSDFWAPEIHHVGTHWVAYFSARGSDGRLAIGAASADAATGPYTALAQPLVHDAAMGLIDASEITTASGTPYLLWKEDGNAQGLPTPIHARPLAADGLSLTGSTATLITNDQAWEGALVEGPFMIEHAGSFYLFYSGNGYASTRYAVGVAKASSPVGPFTKAAGPILVTGGDWAGPGHNSVVTGPGGDSYIIYHAWEAGHVGTAPGRLVLVDQIQWVNGWPQIYGAPSSASRPRP